MATGTVKSLNKERKFGFIREDETRTEYFFHRDDVVDDQFDNIARDCGNNIKVRVSFESVPSNRGPRAANVERV